MSGHAFNNLYIENPNGELLGSSCNGAGALELNCNINITIPQYSLNGIYTISSLQLRDLVGNENYFSGNDLQALGFSTNLIVGNPFNDYEINPLDDIVVADWGWGEHQTIYIDNQALEFMSSGDEIHIIDQNGIITENCIDEDIYGMVSVSTLPYISQTSFPYSLYTVQGIDYCEEAGYIQPGYIEGNPIYFAHFDESENSLHYLDAEYENGNGLFGVEFADTLSFKYFDQSENMIYDIYETIIFSPDMIEGDAINPVQFTVNYSTATSGTPNWEINFYDYEFNGSITSAVYDMGELITNPGDRIAAFVNNVCRGTIDAVETPDPIFEDVIFNLMVYGNSPLTIVSSFNQSLLRLDLSNISTIASTRELDHFNVYRNNQLVGQSISDFYYLDQTIDAGEDYCYSIFLLDDEGNEIFESINQCISITESSCLVPGDTNTDGDLNVLDVVTMVSQILGTLEVEAEQISCSDLNQDGSLNVIDIVMAVAIIMEN